MRPFLFASLLCTLFSLCAAEPEKRSWTVDGATREALVFAPETAKTTPAPLVFGFHGHGGNMNNAAKMFGIHKLWPEAVVVYMQGLPTVSKTDPEGVKNGWMTNPPDNRDLKFFDAVLASMKKDYKIDETKIFATGHSNGGGFTYFLWAVRSDVFAALAPSAAGARQADTRKPKPIMHIGGEADTTVPFENQKKTMEAVRKFNGCDETGKPWDKWCTLYPSKTGTPVVTCIHPGTHKYPEEAPALIVKFFKEFGGSAAAK